MITNGDGGYGILAAYIGGPVAHTGLLCPKVGRWYGMIEECYNNKTSLFLTLGLMTIKPA